MTIENSSLIIKWGFDLTNFKPNGFQQILKQLGITEDSLTEEFRNDLNGVQYRRSFIWHGQNIKIVTVNNPISGEYAQINRRENDKDYASYIGIEGRADQVKKAVELIHEQSDFIKDESPLTRDFI